MSNLSQTVYFLLALLIAVDIHECSHAWVAMQLGDPTVYYAGRVSLNPIVHLDPLGSLMMVFMAFSGVGLGWGKPCPVNPNNLKRGPIVGEAIVSVAGPLSNLLLASITAIPLRLSLNGILPYTLLNSNLGVFLQILFVVNISLMVFNLLPIFPLDGFHFWLGLLHELPIDAAKRLWFTLSSGAFQVYGPMILLLLIFLGKGILGAILNPVFRLASLVLLGS